MRHGTVSNGWATSAACGASWTASGTGRLRCGESRRDGKPGGRTCWLLVRAIEAADVCGIVWVERWRGSGSRTWSCERRARRSMPSEFRLRAMTQVGDLSSQLKLPLIANRRRVGLRLCAPAFRPRFYILYYSCGLPCWPYPATIQVKPALCRRGIIDTASRHISSLHAPIINPFEQKIHNNPWLS